MRILKTTVILVTFLVVLCTICPTASYADPELVNSDGTVNMEVAQIYVRYYEPQSDDGWFKTYLLEDGTAIQVSNLGQIYTLEKGVAVPRGNVNLPTNLQNEPFVALTDGSWILQGNKLLRYYNGECIESLVISQEIGHAKKMIFYNKYNIIYVLSEEGNLYAIDLLDNKVYTMRENQDVRDFALTNFLNAGDVQISILTFENEWLYTMEPRVGEWCSYDRGILGFKEDAVVKVVE